VSVSSPELDPPTAARAPAVSLFRRLSPAAITSLAVLAAVTWALLWTVLRLLLPAPPAPAEYAWLERTYGPGRHSESVEEWVIRDVVRGRRGGVFLDVGAAHFEDKNNTYYLETALGWSGIAVDAIPYYAEGYRRFRPRTRFYSFFVSDRTDQTQPFYELQRNNAASSGDKAFVDRYRDTAVTREVRTITLDRLLDQAGVAHVDVVSMDIELGEPKALAGFDIRRFAPSLVCVEAHPEVRQALVDYFVSRGYVPLGKYLRVDTRNLYFSPAGAPKPPPFPREVLRGSGEH
jgi:FkbM family methyltransferase